MDRGLSEICYESFNSHINICFQVSLEVWTETVALVMGDSNLDETRKETKKNEQSEGWSSIPCVYFCNFTSR